MFSALVTFYQAENSTLKVRESLRYYKTKACILSSHDDFFMEDLATNAETSLLYAYYYSYEGMTQY